MEYLNVKEASLHRRKGVVHKLRILVHSHAVIDDLASTQIELNANVGPFITNLHIGQVTDYTGSGGTVVKISI